MKTAEAVGGCKSHAFFKILFSFNMMGLTGFKKGFSVTIFHLTESSFEFQLRKSINKSTVLLVVGIKPGDPVIT